MNDNRKTQIIGRIAQAALLTVTMTAAFAQGNNAPTGQAGATGTSNVVVTNTAAQPVPMKDQNNAAYQPFHFTTSIFTTVAFANVNVPVPAGKRLVIEQISGEVQLWGSPGSMPSMAVSATTAGVGASAWLPMTYTGEGDSGYKYFATQQVRLYGDGGTNASVSLFKSRDTSHLYSGTVSGYISITGHLVNIP